MDATIAEEYSHDDWPKMPDGSEFDGTQLLQLFCSNKSPFQRDWDLNFLIQEIEHNLNTQVIDIQLVSKGSNNYGLHLKLSNRPDIIARVARGDVNIPGFDGFLSNGKFTRFGLRRQRTSFYARNLTWWLLDYCIIASLCSILNPDFSVRPILQAAACTSSKEPEDKITCGKR